METVVQGQSPHVTFRSTVLAEGNIRSNIGTRRTPNISLGPMSQTCAVIFCWL